jgi:hypothetical protein
MKHAALFAIGLLSVNFWRLDGAQCQTSLAPPMARPAPEVDASPPPVILAVPPTATDDAPPPAATARRVAPPVAARGAPPAPAADHDGFTTSIDDEPVQKLPDLSRTAKRSKPVKEPAGMAGRRMPDSPEDEAIRRKLTICRDCK